MNRLIGKGMVLAVRGYQTMVSPHLGHWCRFTPTCSHYAVQAVQHHGPWRGGLLALQRIGRCHPWGGSGYDPVPPPASHEATPGKIETSPKACET